MAIVDDNGDGSGDGTNLRSLHNNKGIHCGNTRTHGRPQTCSAKGNAFTESILEHRCSFTTLDISTCEQVKVVRMEMRWKWNPEEMGMGMAEEVVMMAMTTMHCHGNSKDLSHAFESTATQPVDQFHQESIQRNQQQLLEHYP